VISSAVPEAIIKTCEVDSVIELFTEDFVNSVTHVAIGMGLGQDNWSSALLEHCVQLNKPMLVDADGLNLLAKSELVIHSELIITPHPGEAARLLMQAKEQVNQPGSAGIQNNRFHAIRVLFELFDSAKACVVILKGSGTLIFDGQTLKVCNLGNAAMAAPGMGDVLSGIVIALLAQGIQASDAAELGVCLHAAAAQSVTQEKTRGLLASDVVKALPGILR
jgi:hydroxyethylthiazole kinase-like uncharacterized protein yjeF